MKVAVSTDNGMVAEHFGRCPQYTIAEISEGKIVSKKVIDNPGHSTGFLPKYFKEQGVEAMITGGAGWRAQQLFQEYNISLVLGITGKVDEALERFAKGTLSEGESFCEPGKGKGYGIKKEDGHGE